MKNLYLYLASRSKNGIKIITVLQGEEPVNSDLSDLTELGLPQIWQNKIQQIIYENRMLYHPRIESSINYKELTKSLKNRGYKNLPLGVSPILNMAGYAKAPVADTSSCKIKQTMLRRKKLDKDQI